MPDVWWPKGKIRAVDVELGINDRRTGRLVQIGVVGPDIGEISILLDTESEIGRHAIDIPGVTPEEASKAVPFWQIAEELHALLEDCVLICHNKSHDPHYIELEFRRCGMRPPKYRRVVCTVQLCRDTKTPGLHNLGTITRMLNIPLTHHHNGLHDARACYRVFIAMMNRHPDFRTYFYGDVVECRSAHFLHGEEWLKRALIHPVDVQIIHPFADFLNRGSEWMWFEKTAVESEFAPLEAVKKLYECHTRGKHAWSSELLQYVQLTNDDSGRPLLKGLRIRYENTFS